MKRKEKKKKKMKKKKKKKTTSVGESKRSNRGSLPKFHGNSVSIT